jgi:hypothetical protein
MLGPFLTNSSSYNFAARLSCELNLIMIGSIYLFK